MINLLFIHNTAMPYRIPFFKKINDHYITKFVFTNIDISQKLYGVEGLDQINKLNNVNYIFINNYFGVAFFGLIRELLSNDYDIIIDSFPYNGAVFSFIISKFKRKPIIFWSEMWDWENKIKAKKKIGIKKLINFLISKAIIKYSDAFIVPGTQHKKYLISLGSKSKKIFIMPNASNISPTNDDLTKLIRLKEELGLDNKYVILYVGRLRERKGVQFLIKAFAKLQTEIFNTALVIVGTGECKERLERLCKIKKVQKNVFFLGHVDDALLPAIYLSCDICVIPSITHIIGDPWVFVLNEAMYFGKPVIATDAVGAAYDLIIDGKNGFIVPERDENRLYQALKKLLDNPELKKNMGEESMRIIKNRCGYDNMFNEFNKAIEYVIK